jgi:hypothetical protein
MPRRRWDCLFNPNKVIKVFCILELPQFSNLVWTVLFIGVCCFQNCSVYSVFICGGFVYVCVLVMGYS